MPIIDVTDPYNAKWLLNWTFTGDGRPHDLSTNEDGTRIYVGATGQFRRGVEQFLVRAGRPGDPGHERHSVSVSRIRRSGLSAGSSGTTKGKRNRCSPSSRADGRTSSAQTSPAASQASVVWRRHVPGERRHTAIRMSSTSPTRRTPESSRRSCSKCTTPGIARNSSRAARSRRREPRLFHREMRCGPSEESDDGRLRLERHRYPGLRHSGSPPPRGDRVLEGASSTEWPSFRDRVAGHRPSIEPSKSRPVWRAL